MKVSMIEKKIKPNRGLAIQLASKQREVFILDASNLEGCNYTIPDIQTLLGGVSVGGHTLEDQNIALNQAASWKKLFSDLRKSKFELNVDYILKSHALIAKEEALTWGEYRYSGVTIAGSSYLPPSNDAVPELMEALLSESLNIESPIDKGIHVFLQIARIQPFFDGNKRTGRLMMNGIFLDAGFPAISIPPSRELEFNTFMLRFYNTNKEEEMSNFIRSCVDDKIVNIMKL